MVKVFAVIKYSLKILLVAIFIFLTGCQPGSQEEETIRPVKTMVIAESEKSLTRIFPGQVRPADEVKLSFRVSNQLNELPVKKGQYVQKDEIIAALDTRDFETARKNIAGRLDEARANLKAMQAGARNEDIKSLEASLEAALVAHEEARLQYERYEQLYSMGAVAKADLDRARSRKHEAAGTAKSLEMELQKSTIGARPEDIEAMQARIKSLEAGLEEARSALDDSRLKAPFSGYIAERYVDNFDLIQAGQPIVKLQDTTRLEVSVGIPEQLMTHKDLITSIHIRLESYQDHFFPARIKEISTDASGPSRTYRLTAIMDKPESIPVFPSMAADMYVAFALQGRDNGSVTIPETALVSLDGKMAKVWIFDEDKQRAFSREVVAGQATSNGIRITAGLNTGDIIITAGGDYLQEGQKVRTLKK